jgi:hypothetical protein
MKRPVETHYWQILRPEEVELFTKGKTVLFSYAWDAGLWLYFKDGTGLEVYALHENYVKYEKFTWEVAEEEGYQ